MESSVPLSRNERLIRFLFFQLQRRSIVYNSSLKLSTARIFLSFFSFCIIFHLWVWVTKLKIENKIFNRKARTFEDNVLFMSYKLALSLANFKFELCYGAEIENLTPEFSSLEILEYPLKLFIVFIWRLVSHSDYCFFDFWIIIFFSGVYTFTFYRLFE